MNRQQANRLFGRMLLKTAMGVFLTLGIAVLPVQAAAKSEDKAIERVQQTAVPITGTVKDKEGDPVIGANIIEKGTANGTITDLNGKFKLSVKNSHSVLVISYVGYKTQEVIVGSNRNKEIILYEDARMMDEVVVIGYGTQRKGDITSAVSSVKAEDFLAGNIQDASQLIKGKVAGLVITTPSGDPNSGSSINLRGLVSIAGNSEPLVLIDGTPGDMATVAPENIASIDVLKDASAAAIYGTRGAAGVILITTKTGHREEKATVQYSGYMSLSSFCNKIDMMGPSDIRAEKTNFADLGYDTDWVKGITQTGYTQNHSVSVSGGGKSTTYAANATYRKAAGVMKSTGNEEWRMSVDLNQYLLKDIVKLNFNLFKNFRRENLADANYAYRQAIIRNPTAPAYNEDGSYNEDFGLLQYYNPIAVLKEKTRIKKGEDTRMTANVTIEPIKGWQTNLMAATHRSTGNENIYTTHRHYTVTTENKQGLATRKHLGDQRDLLELTSKYESVIEKHRVSGLLGYSYQHYFWDNFEMTNHHFPNDDFLWYNMGGGTALIDGKASMGNERVDSRLVGFFGRFSYGYDDRYNVLISLRHEGSTKFGANNKWGNFPSVSLGWTLSNERFMKSLTWLDNLKLRAGFGVTGVEPYKSYLSLTRYKYSKSGYWYDGTKWNQGIVLNNEVNANPDLKWEKSEEWNFGLDVSVLDRRLSANLDIYRKDTKDLLYDYAVPVPPNLLPKTTANVARLRSTGWELMIHAIPVRTKDLEWSSTLTMSRNTTKLVSLSNDLYQASDYWYTGYASDPITMETHRAEIGGEMGRFWGMKTVGITEKGVWLIEDPRTGDAVEYNEDIKSDLGYRQYLGSGLPKLTLGWNNTIQYKGFDLTMQMNGQFGHKILNAQRMFYENNSIAYNRLKSAGDKVYGIAVLSKTMPQTFLSYYLERGDYFKMTNMTLGYTVAPKILTGWVDKIRVYVSGDNLFCITKYKGLDPELATNYFAAGYDDRDKYPSIRSFTFGLNITF